jgi:hypothetical protein
VVVLYLLPLSYSLYLPTVYGFLFLCLLLNLLSSCSRPLFLSPFSPVLIVFFFWANPVLAKADTVQFFDIFLSVPFVSFFSPVRFPVLCPFAVCFTVRFLFVCPCGSTATPVPQQSGLVGATFLGPVQK